MKGTHRIIIQNKRIRYDFTLKRNITIIRGDSATGKTTLVDMVRDYYENGAASAVELHCDKECAVLEGRSWKAQLATLHDAIVFIDEDNDFVASDQFADAIQHSAHYYVIVTREGIPSLPYSVEEIYGIRNSGKYGTLKRTYNELYHIYPKMQNDAVVKPDTVLTEDSNSGFQFFAGRCSKSNISCFSAQGKSNLFALASRHAGEQLLVIADGAAFGSEMEKMMRLISIHPEITLYLPESFEWLILKSGLLRNSEIEQILTAPEDYIESKDYFSWERFFTALLIRQTQDSYLKYAKRQLNPVYLQEHEAKMIVAVMEKIELE